MFIDPYNRTAFNYRNAASISTHNTNPLARTPDDIYIGGDGDVVCRPEGADADVTFRNLKAGLYLPCRVTHIRTTGTTATNLVGLFSS